MNICGFQCVNLLNDLFSFEKVSIALTNLAQRLFYYVNYEMNSS